MEKHLTSMQSADGVPHQPFLFTIAWKMLSNGGTNPIGCNYGRSGVPTQACTCSEAGAITASERLYTRRYGFEVPPVSCPIHSPLTNTNGHEARSINLSSRGVYFVTNHPVLVWLPVQVLLRMPRRTTKTLPSERIFTGRVREVEWKDVPSGNSGVGVELFYWQTRPTAIQ
jgi:hypothetical protein